VLRGLGASGVRRAEVLDVPEGGDRFTTNTQESQPVGLRQLDGVGIDEGVLKLTLPALSWAVVELDVSTV